MKVYSVMVCNSPFYKNEVGDEERNKEFDKQFPVKYIENLSQEVMSNFIGLFPAGVTFEVSVKEDSDRVA